MIAIDIPFQAPSAAGHEARYVADVIGSGRLTGGAYAARCEILIAQLVGAPRVRLTTSATHALEMAALLLDVGPGDEVILPSFTFVSVANAFVLRGARPVFADVRPDTLNLDEAALEDSITPRTKVIVAVHYGGVACHMDRILDVGRRRGVTIVEDAAHALLGRYQGRWLGTLAPLAALSFHGTKNLTCGEGGALVVNDARFAERAEVLRDMGTNRARFARGQVEAYTWVDVGSSYHPSELQAAFLLGQLEARERIQAGRARVSAFYARSLTGWAAARGVRLPAVPPDCESSHHIYWMILPSRDERESLRAHLAKAGIGSAFHYQPLHLSAMGRSFGGRPGQCPVAEQVAGRILRLPIYPSLTDEALERIADAVTSWKPAATGAAS
jgi:dTDP-4-amino-4,6-dideoxygalactose transaminase